MNAGCQQQDPENRKKAEYYNTLAQTVFFPIYPVIANQILERTGIDQGHCLDIGSGPGHLAIALAALSDLKVCAMDNSREMYGIAQANIEKYRIEHRVRSIYGDVSEIPFPESSVDLVVSRGSIFLWKNLTQGFSECRRVLRPGGAAYIGTGFGNVRLKNEVLLQMHERDPFWDTERKRRSRNCTPNKVRSALAVAGISDYDIIQDDSGFWVMFRRQ